jgi:hypothetical protein
MADRMAFHHRGARDVPSPPSLGLARAAPPMGPPSGANPGTGKITMTRFFPNSLRPILRRRPRADARRGNAGPLAIGDFVVH